MPHQKLVVGDNLECSRKGCNFAISYTKQSKQNNFVSNEKVGVKIPELFYNDKSRFMCKECAAEIKELLRPEGYADSYNVTVSKGQEDAEDQQVVTFDSRTLIGKVY